MEIEIGIIKKKLSLKDLCKKNWVEGIRVIVVAIGKGIDVEDLKSMTKHHGVSDDTHDHFFHVENDIEELTSDTFIQNSIEGCNFAAGKNFKV